MIFFKHLSKVMVIFLTVASYAQLDCTATFEAPSDETTADFVDSLWPEHERYPMPSAENICFDSDYYRFTDKELDLLLKALRDIYTKLPHWLSITECDMHHPRHRFVYKLWTTFLIKEALTRCNPVVARKHHPDQITGYLFDYAEQNNTLGCAIAIAAGADVNYRRLDDMTPLQATCNGEWRRDPVDTIRLLLRHGAHSNPAASRPPLHIACSKLNVAFDTRVIEMLIEEGLADVNARFKNTTALHLVCQTSPKYWPYNRAWLHHKTVEAAKILLKHGARVDVTDHDGHTPVFCARLQENKELVALLNAYETDARL